MLTAPTSTLDASDRMLQGTFAELRQGVTLRGRGTKWTLSVDERQVEFRLPFGPAMKVFLALQHGGLSLSDLARLPEENDRTVNASTEIQKLWKYGWLEQVALCDSVRVATLRNFGDTAFFPSGLALSERVFLSENALIRRTGCSLSVESVTHGAAVQLTDSRLFNLPGLLLMGSTVEAVSERLRLPDYVIATVMGWLLALGAAEFTEANGPATGWSFSDRLMHARGRRGRHIGGYGATFPLRDKVSEPPAIRRPVSDRTIQLSTPDLDEIRRNDVSFTSVLEGRHSVREHSATPMAFDELAQFLYRVARVTVVTRNELYEIAERPYPSGGGLHELELYPLVNRCEGVAPGLYRYNGALHCLEHVTEPTGDTQRLLFEAKQTCLMQSDPQILLLVAARFLRVNWKYESIAYALILKNVGVLYQTMYLVATAMGLGPCCLGGGNADGFCRAAQLEYWEESLVGEFMLGRPAELKHEINSTT